MAATSAEAAIVILMLDLWGLASNDAVRQTNKSPQWLDEITRRNNTGSVMIYPEAFRLLPASWTKMAELMLSQ